MTCLNRSPRGESTLRSHLLGFEPSRARGIGILVGLAALLCCDGAGGAQPATNTAAGPLEVIIHGLDANQQPVTLPTDRALRLITGRSAIVEIVDKTSGEQQAIAKASIGAKEIADLEAMTPKQVQVTGREEGSTTLILWTEDGRHRMFDVIVGPEPPSMTERDELQVTISRDFPQARVRAQFVRDTIVLTGEVPTAEMAEQIVSIAEAFVGAPDATDKAIAAGQGGAMAAAMAGATRRDQGSTASMGSPAQRTPKVKNHMRVLGIQQVLLRCTVAEVSKRAIRQLGVNGWLAGDNIRDVFAINNISAINPTDIALAPTANIIQPNGLRFQTPGGTVTGQTTFTLGFPRVQLQLFFQALRENDLVRILAEPNLVAIPGQEASFLAGGEIPVPVPQATGGGVTITIEWKEFGIRLKFLATPMDRDMIRLRVAPEVSELDPTIGVQLPFGGGIGFVPGLRQRKAETTIELASGSTIAIAGLLSDATRGVSQKIPGLGDIPVLGALFSSVSYQNQQTELVVLVTPELVSSMNPDQVAPVPGQYMTAPNDWQLFGLGLVEGLPEPDPDARELAVKTGVPTRTRKWSSPPTQQSLHGPWGTATEAEVQ